MLTPPNQSPPDGLSDGPSDKLPVKTRYAWHRLHVALMPDYNGPAAAYWWAVTLLGGAVLAQALHYFWQQPVDLQLGIVLGDADLAGNVEGYLAQIVREGDAIDERDDEVEPRLEHPVKAPEALDDQRMLLRHDADRAHDDDDRDDEERDREQR